MEIKKSQVKTNSTSDIPKDTLTPKQARMILEGLTVEMVQLPELLSVTMNGHPRLIIKAKKYGRLSRYKMQDVYTLRNCCALVNGICSNTYGMYVGKNDPFYDYYYAPFMKPEKSQAAALRWIIGEYLDSVGYSLAIVPMGMVVAKSE